MTDDGSYTAASASDDEGRQLARLLEGYAVAQVARVLALLGVPDHLDGGARTAPELAAAVGAAPGPLARVLAAASNYGLIAREGPHHFALTSLGALLRSDAPGSLRLVAAGFLAPPVWNAWGKLADIVRTGQPGDGATWEYFRDHPEDGAWFARAMSQASATAVTGLAAAGYQPPGAEVIVDVGGGRGALLAALLRSAPQARGVLLDRPEALAEARSVLGEPDIAGRAELVAGDFFEHVPDGDLHVLSNVLHDWEDAEARQILANCHRSSRPGGGLLVLTFLLPAAPGPSPAYTMDLLMMVVEAGRERTQDDYQALLAAEGWGFVRHVQLGPDSPWHVLEFRRD